jgi:cell division transport system permease protein
MTESEPTITTTPDYDQADVAETVTRKEAPIVPVTSIAGRALVAVIAIMTFLAAVTLGAVILVHGTAREWQSDLAREVTIQVRPAPGRDIEAEVQRAVEVARATPGVAEVRPYSRAESAQLLEPWLGTGLSLDDLPVPRLIVLRLGEDTAPDLDRLRAQLGEKVTGASLDDHRGWTERMRAMAGTAVALGGALLGLVLAATMLCVTFATRSAMATNRPIVEVLHFVGAKDGFIAGEFQQHFLLLGFKGGAIGGGAAIALFLLANLIGRWFRGSAEQDQLAALFGTFAIGPAGYGAIVGLVVLIAAVTAATSRLIVQHTLQTME